MSLGIWERQRDILFLQKLKLVNELAELYQLRDSAKTFESEEHVERADRLITILIGKIAHQEALIEDAEMRVKDER